MRFVHCDECGDRVCPAYFPADWVKSSLQGHMFGCVAARDHAANLIAELEEDLGGKS